MPVARVVTAVAVLLVVAGCGSDATFTAGGVAVEPNAAVLDVSDGDTITVDLAGRSETVRLIGIDTPETVDPRKPVQCFGREASARTHELLPEGTAVRIERDVEARDRYGRLLAYVYRASDGLFVNMALVADGYALTLSVPPNVAHGAAFSAAARQARERNAGLWSSCPAGTDQPAD